METRITDQFTTALNKNELKRVAFLKKIKLRISFVTAIRYRITEFYMNNRVTTLLNSNGKNNQEYWEKENLGKDILVKD